MCMRRNSILCARSYSVYGLCELNRVIACERIKKFYKNSVLFYTQSRLKQKWKILAAESFKTLAKLFEDRLLLHVKKVLQNV